MHSWNNSIFKTIFKNKNGFLRSGWTILIVMLLYYALLYFASFLVLTALIVILTATGDLNRAADYLSPLIGVPSASATSFTTYSPIGSDSMRLLSAILES